MRHGVKRNQICRLQPFRATQGPINPKMAVRLNTTLYFPPEKHILCSQVYKIHDLLSEIVFLCCDDANANQTRTTGKYAN